jgi:hypothetical protein
MPRKKRKFPFLSSTSMGLAALSNPFAIPAAAAPWRNNSRRLSMFSVPIFIHRYHSHAGFRVMPHKV